MAENDSSRGLADVMVSHLFANRDATRLDRVLYPGCGDGELVRAVHDYCEGTTFGYTPKSVVVDTDVSDSLPDRYPDVETHEVDFLGEGLNFGRKFDYVLCDPPKVSWTTLSREQRRAYATNSALVTTDDDPVGPRSDFLFIEQSLRHLSNRGRAVFLTDEKYKDDPTASRLRESLSKRVQDVVDVTQHVPSGSESVVTVLDNRFGPLSDPPFKYEPAQHEALLNVRIEEDQPFTARATMTEDPVSYGPDESSTAAYIDLMQDDYDAGLVRSEEGSSGVSGYVSRESLRLGSDQPVSECQKRLTGRVTIPGDAHISDVVERLGRERFLFVENVTGVEGVVTRFDLNRLPVYLHLYDCFSEFEIGLRNFVRENVSDWRERGDVRVGTTPTTDLVSDELTTAQLSDLIEIVEESGVRSELGLEYSDSSIDDLRKLRNAVAHYNPIVHTMGDTPTWDEARRGAPQLASEYALLQSSISELGEYAPAIH
ncbi:hypothetical protein [Halomarina rubra]|uniref:Uncharacterized protein n=1 Tax=Halomarina rubra TaxID=2071873 RepID=A0ABD6AVR8_9EURY|nr:hypothetical protein [Halomarina rubra]